MPVTYHCGKCDTELNVENETIDEEGITHIDLAPCATCAERASDDLCMMAQDIRRKMEEIRDILNR